MTQTISVRDHALLLARPNLDDTDVTSKFLVRHEVCG